MDGDRPQVAELDNGTGYKVHLDYAPAPARKIEGRPANAPDQPAEHAEEGGDEKPATPRWKKILYWGIGAVVALALITGGLLYWLHSRNYVSTDDAFVDAHISQVSSQVAGRVTQVAVQDYQHVKAGDLLIQLDGRDFQVRLDQAKAQRAQAAAQLEQAKAGVLQRQADVDQAQANLRVAQAELGQAQSDYARYRSIDQKAVSRQQVESASATAKSAQARVDAASQVVAAARANLEAQHSQIVAAEANLKQADATISNAELQLSYAAITAPRDGQIAKRTVELGNYVNPGQALMAVVGDDRWITANFKETELAQMRAGQPVTVSVDSCPDHGVDGTVDSFQPGSGSVFSALPPENATGNYVKVVQRIPVKITIKHQDAVTCRLSPGMSVEPSVKVR